MTDMRKKNHLTFRDDLSMFDNFFQSRTAGQRSLRHSLTCCHMADILILTMRFQNQEHQLTRSRGVAVITSPCHGEDRGFDSRRDRL